MKRISIGFIFCVFVLAGCGAAQSDEPDFFIAAEWNVQALFDGQEKGNEYGEYREAAGWTAEKYAARITAVSQAVLQMIREGKSSEKTASGKSTVPDLIGFVEIENAGVLEDLARGAISKHGYFWTAFTALPGSSLGLGVLSRYPLSGIRAHSITVGKETAPRPVLELRVEPGGKPGMKPGKKPLVFLLCHWKSKLGGDIATEALRRSSARVVQRRLRELKETEAETPVIVMGDLNENHNEYYRHNGKMLCALLPDESGAALLTASLTASLKDHGAAEFLVLSGEKPPRARCFENVVALYSPWEGEMKGGSFYYKDEWETIDHFLLSDGLFNGEGWEYAGCEAVNHAPFTGTSGKPNTYVPRSGRGLSDHLPLLLYLKNLPM